MIELNVWLEQYRKTVEEVFGTRIVCIGLQGSYGRGEANPESDLDMVLILDTLSMDDLRLYHRAAERLPERDKLCGFVCGKAELLAWDKADALSLYQDTMPIVGDLEFLRPLFTAEDLIRNILTAACGLYHACCHHFLFGHSKTFLYDMRKPVFFLLRSEYEYRTGQRVCRREELWTKLDTERRFLLEPEGETEENLSRLFTWAGQLIRELGGIPKKDD